MSCIHGTWEIPIGHPSVYMPQRIWTAGKTALEKDWRIGKASLSTLLQFFHSYDTERGENHYLQIRSSSLLVLSG